MTEQMKIYQVARQWLAEWSVVHKWLQMLLLCPVVLLPYYTRYHQIIQGNTIKKQSTFFLSVCLWTTSRRQALLLSQPFTLPCKGISRLLAAKAKKTSCLIKLMMRKNCVAKAIVLVMGVIAIIINRPFAWEWEWEEPSQKNVARVWVTKNHGSRYYYQHFFYFFTARVIEYLKLVLFLVSFAKLLKAGLKACFRARLKIFTFFSAPRPWVR